MILKKRMFTAAVAAALALALAACGGPAGSGDGPAAGASGEPVVGGEATVLTLAEPRTLDPALLSNAYATTAAYGNALYGQLLIDTPDGIEYRMAESFETTDGGATFTLVLKPGLTFTDGTPLNAEAVKFNWDRIKDPNLPTNYRDEVAMIGSTAVVDDTTLLVTMATPVPNYAYVVSATSLTWIGSPTALQAGTEAFDANPIGAGPYVLENWTRQDSFTVTRNPDYYDAPRPYLDSITFRPALDSAQRLNTVISGGADVAVETNWTNLAQAEQGGLPSTILPLSGGNFLTLNTRRAPFNDIRARQAVADALDFDQLNTSVYSGAGRLATSLFDESSPLHTDQVLQAPDRESAQRLFDELAAAGTPVSFTFKSFPTSENRAIAESVQAQLATFENVSMEIQIVDLAEVGALRNSYDFDVLVSSAFFVDPDPRLYSAFHTGSAANLSGISDPELDAALAGGRTATNDDERRGFYETVQDRLAELDPVIFYARAAPSAVSTRDVGGLRQYGFGSLLVDELWLQQ